MELRGVRILLVEDETLVAFLLEALLQDLGCDHVEHVASLPQAMAAIDRGSPDIAILDINLAGVPVFPVAERLAQAGIPFIFASGYGRAGLPQQWSGSQLVDKPYEIDAVTAALQRALDAAPQPG